MLGLEVCGQSSLATEVSIIFSSVAQCMHFLIRISFGFTSCWIRCFKSEIKFGSCEELWLTK